MIKVTVLFDSHVGNHYPIDSIVVNGHAGSGPYGHDLACAAVSAITFGGLNALESGQNSYDVKIQEGHFEIKLKPGYDSSENSNEVLHVVLTQLKTIAKSYPELVKVTEKFKD